LSVCLSVYEQNFSTVVHDPGTKTVEISCKNLGIKFFLFKKL